MNHQENLQSQGITHKVIAKLPAQTEIQRKFLKATAGHKKAIHQPRFKPTSATDSVNIKDAERQDRFKNDKS